MRTSKYRPSEYLMAINLDISSAFSETEKKQLEAATEEAYKRCTNQFQSTIDDGVTLNAIIKSGYYGGEGSFDGIRVSIENAKIADYELLRSLIHHEMVHFFQARILGKNNQYSLPKWFSEGMAVAFSGQGMLPKSQAALEVFSEFSEIQAPERYIFMDRHIDYNIIQTPYNNLYNLWGTMFIYTISNDTKINSNYETNDGPHLNS